MSYLVKKTNGQILVEVSEETVNRTSASVALVGKRSREYGLAFAENFIKLTENFANTTPPPHPLIGQTWYNSSLKTLMVYDGSSWTPTGGTALNSDNQATFGYNSPFSLELTNGHKKSVIVFITQGVMVAIMSGETIPNQLLPEIITINGNTYPIKNVFENGLVSGLNLASNSHSFNGDRKWGKERELTLNGDISGNVLVDGSSNISITTTLDDTGVEAGTYNVVTVDKKGRVLRGSNEQSVLLSGDVQGTLDNNNLVPTGVIPGTYNGLTVDEKGRITDAEQFAQIDISSEVDLSDDNIAASSHAVKKAYDLAENSLPKTGGFVSGDLTVGGDFVVHGTRTEVNARTLVSENSVLLLGGTSLNPPTMNDGKNRGISFWRYKDNKALKGFMGWNEGEGVFMFIPDATEAADRFSGPRGTIRANLQGNADTATRIQNFRMNFDGDVKGNAHITDNNDTVRLSLADTIQGNKFFDDKVVVGGTVLKGDNTVFEVLHSKVNNTPDASATIYSEKNGNSLIQLGVGKTHHAGLAVSDNDGNISKLVYRNQSREFTFETNSNTRMRVGDHIHFNVPVHGHKTVEGEWIASDSEALTGVRNDKIMTPYLVKKMIKEGKFGTKITHVEGSRIKANNGWQTIITANLNVPEGTPLFIYWGVSHFYETSDRWAYRLWLNTPSNFLEERQTYMTVQENYPGKFVFTTANRSGNNQIGFDWKAVIGITAIGSLTVFASL